MVASTQEDYSYRSCQSPCDPKVTPIAFFIISKATVL